ncbi:DUF3833 family protein [Rhodovibrio salinarum]|uniref:DUF3833 domain-containing protein n=1 Tax=Rhodovibrio salinarum TaxID=1087 RepID=A0A934V0Y1_9PROT|nr:DUF3833 family protein [Rhodovibrio salinarum]MBK1697574.1 DUF3833 domain-containing protein [Rhodovibrio salinarum]
MKPEDFASNEPAFALEDFFAGKGKAWGLFQDRFGKVRKQFVADTHGTWDPVENKLALTESFVYDDGSQEARTWHIRKLDNGYYQADTDDLVGAAEIEAAGNAVNLRYRMKVPINGKSVALDFDDWMFRQSDDMVIDRAIVTKWGVQIGTLIISFQRTAAQSGGQQAAE